MRFPEVHNTDELLQLVEDVGFLPFFANEIRGFSVEDHCPRELWFTDAEGPWEWKGPAARSCRCVYGKFFCGKAGFVSRQWLAEFANCRRDGYDFDARWDDGLARRKDKEIYDVLTDQGALLSKKLKEYCNDRKGGNKGFDTVITRLQMQTYVTVADFVYMKDRFGKQYGWGVAEYTTPEKLFGYDVVTASYAHSPEESRKRIFEHLSGLLPQAAETQLTRLIG